MVLNKLYWDANNAVGLSKQRNSYQSSPTFLCFESPTASFASKRNLFRGGPITALKSLFYDSIPCVKYSCFDKGVKGDALGNTA